MNDMSTAPKDGTVILGFHEDECVGQKCGTDGKLCLYHGHAEGLSTADPGWNLIVWGGGFDDRSYEHPDGANMPDWWFTHDSEFERVANPVGWLPIPE